MHLEGVEVQVEAGGGDDRRGLDLEEAARSSKNARTARERAGAGPEAPADASGVEPVGLARGGAGAGARALDEVSVAELAAGEGAREDGQVAGGEIRRGGERRVDGREGVRDRGRGRGGPGDPAGDLDVARVGSRRDVARREAHGAHCDRGGPELNAGIGLARGLHHDQDGQGRAVRAGVGGSRFFAAQGQGSFQAMTTPSRLAPLCAAALIALHLSTLPARAQEPAADKAAGMALFEDARKSAASGDYEHSCPKFAEALRLYPAAAIALNLADCYEHVGKVASAWASWKQAEIMARNAGDTDREQVAVKRGQALAPTLPKLTIVVPPATHMPGLEVRRDGTLVGEGQWGSPLPTDPGAHAIDASAPGHRAWSTVVRIETTGGAASVEIPALDVLATPAPAGGTPALFWSPRRTAGAAVGGAGVGLGAVLVAIFGGLAASKKSESSSHCVTTNGVTACDPTGLALRGDAKTLAVGADVALALGGAAVIAGVVLFATAPSGDAAKPPSTGLRVRPVPGLRGPGVSIRRGVVTHAEQDRRRRDRGDVGGRGSHGLRARPRARRRGASREGVLHRQAEERRRNRRRLRRRDVLAVRGRQAVQGRRRLQGRGSAPAAHARRPLATTR